MGCDIHMYVEYKRKENNNWNSFGGRINPGRNYWMFGLISKGVRSDFEESFKPKGMPEDASYHSRNDNQIYISDDKPTWVENSDWHSHTWLTLDEYRKVIENYNKAASIQEPEYEALLAAMEKLNELGNDVRVVLWFDN